jgi:hypothetical protein
VKNVPFAVEYWIIDIIRWNNGTSKDFCAASVTLEKFQSSIQELMKE